MGWFPGTNGGDLWLKSRGSFPGPASCGHGLQVALQLADGRLIQGEEVKVKGCVGDVEMPGFLNEIHDLGMGKGSK